MGRRDHVEIEGFQTAFVLRRIDKAAAGGDAELFQIGLERFGMGLQGRVGIEELDHEGLAIGQQQFCAVALAASRPQHFVGAAQKRPVRSRSVRHRRQPRFAKHLVGHFAAPRFQ